MIKHHSDETQLLEVKQYFEAIKKYAQSIPEKRYPHQNRYIALRSIADAGFAGEVLESSASSGSELDGVGSGSPPS